MDPELATFLAVPTLIGGVFGAVVGYAKAVKLSIFVHGLLLVLAAACAILTAIATGWDGIIWILGILVIGAGWIAFALCQGFGYLVRRASDG